jgi:hypothetical protein
VGSSIDIKSTSIQKARLQAKHSPASLMDVLEVVPQDFSTGLLLIPHFLFDLVLNVKPVPKWTANEVFEWAKTIVKEDNAKQLKDQGVDGTALLKLTKDQLIDGYPRFLMVLLRIWRRP